MKPYNPKTFTPKTEINVFPVDDRDSFYKFYVKEAYPTREDALKAYYGEPISYWEDGILYHGDITPVGEYVSVTDVFVSPGINWCMYYAVTLERLCELLKNQRHIDEEIVEKYAVLNREGLYEIDVHYDGRCR